MIIYDELKAKQKKHVREREYFDEIFMMITSMFNYTNLPDSIPPDIIEKYLALDGQCYFTKLNGELVVMRGGREGNLDVYGRGTNFICTSPVGEVHGTIDVDGVEMWNNNTHTPDYYISRYSHYLSEVDLSLEYNVKWSRLNPIPIAKDSNSKKAIMSALDNMEKGKTETILSNNISLDGTGNIDILNLTDVKNIEKVQYLTQLHDELEKRIYTRYGLATGGKEKLAQVNSEELHNTDTNAQVTPYDRLKYRKDALEKVNSLFGTNIGVEFATPWVNQFATMPSYDLMDESSDENIDESNDGGEEDNNNVE